MRITIQAALRKILIVVLIVLILAISFFMYQRWKYPGTVEEKVSLYSYGQKASVDYKAIYRPNILTGAVAVGAGETYITNYLDNILTTFNYEFQGERAAGYKGAYNISAALIGWRKEQDNVVTIWKKEYQLVPSTPFEGTDASFGLSRDLSLNLRPYNDFVKRFTEETDISSDVNLVVRWDVALEVNTDRGVIKESAAPTLVIPINKSYFNITGEQNKEKKGAIEESITKILPVNKRLLYLCGTVFAFFLITLVFLVFFTKGSRLTDPLAIKMKEIIKKHGERLVALSGDAAVDLKMAVPVKTLEDLIKIADELTRPVMYKAGSEPENLPAFYVFDDPKTYVYKIEIEPLEKPLEEEVTGKTTMEDVDKGKGEEM